MFMANSDGTGNVKDGLLRVGMAAIAFLCIIGAAEWTGNQIVMTLVGGVVCSLLAKLATSVTWKTSLVWGAIGALAGFLFYYTL